MLLAGLYEILGSVTSKLKGYEADPNLLLAGPYWLLQLWLNATFKPCTSGTMNEKDPNMLNRTIEGTRILQLTPNDETENLQNCSPTMWCCFQSVIISLLLWPLSPIKLTTLLGSLRHLMILWRAYTKFEDIWYAFLLPRLLVSRIITVKNHVCLLAYQPNFMSHQFRLCQLFPDPLFNWKQEHYVARVDYTVQDIAKYQSYHANFAEFQLIPFHATFYTMKGFHTWWTCFYTNNIFDTASICKHLTKAFSFVQEHI